MARIFSDTFFCESIATGSLTASVGSQLVVGPSRDRKSLYLSSNCPDPIFVRLGEGGASSAAFTIRLAAYERIEFPKPVYAGAVHAAFGSSSGSLKFLDIS
jgi:acyl dehydratase